MRFTEKSVLITGAGGGFGRLAALRFVDEGAGLTLQDINEEALAETAELCLARGGKVVSLAGDVSDEDHGKALVELAVHTFGQLDIAVNNAGLSGELRRIVDTPLEAYDLLMSVNARGVFIGMKYQISAMVAAGGGAILNVSSAAGLVGAGNLGAYAASKHAVIGMTRAAADETARHAIRINAICPSFAATAMVETMADQMTGRRDMSRDDAFARIAGRVPMRRVGTPEEVVQAMLWIVSPENSFMTGQAIAIDGGLTAI